MAARVAASHVFPTKCPPGTLWWILGFGKRTRFSETLLKDSEGILFTFSISSIIAKSLQCTNHPYFINIISFHSMYSSSLSHFH